ncbi:MAG: helix-turn-helix transcriptional regulator [Fibrobacter sp.]|uniref:helix-turn-helix domain-containing protein n=1 Tax=Fibrobacter sp. TaxID=35828 RepID=UPI002A91BCBD|nr:helix-turn-helix transcriptional regulator [Fibrobacter sp.]MDY6264354.1 helix-turn-helix transcriptional regulator [Fibrobacter sp.]
MQNLGEQIAQRRKYFKLSQLDLAEMSGISPRTVSAIENGNTNPSLGTLSKILEILGLVITLQERVIYE